MTKVFVPFLAACVWSAPDVLAAQTMTVEEYEPKSTLVVPEHTVTRARFPFIDVHSHQRGTMSAERLDQLVSDMDGLNMGVMVNLSGGTGERLTQTVQNMKGRYPNRFVVFATVSFDGIDDPDYGRRAAAQLERDVQNGAQGLKIFKNLGLTLRDTSGNRIAVDDRRFDPVWAKCAELGIPVLIHTGEPASFFEPHDMYNERWLELKQFSRRARPPDEFPSWEQVMGEQWNVFRRHPQTTFIAAHLAWLGGDLARLGRLFDELPNMHAGIGAVLAELGRQPRFAREWFIRYQDRVMFGKDSWNPTEYHVYFRTMETGDEYFDYYRKRHAFWKMYGLNLPDEVLKKLYYENALRIIPGIERSLFPQDSPQLPYDDMAARIVAALQPEAGERAIVRYDSAALPGLEAQVGRSLAAADVTVELLPYGPVSDFATRLSGTDIYIWLPTSEAQPHPPEQLQALGRWLDAGKGRQIHFHWGGGTMGTDGIPGEHSPQYDRVYVAALDIDHGDLDRRQTAAIATLRRAQIRVVTPAGTDIRFRVGSRPFNQQNGDASKRRTSAARTRIDREIELPAGVVRVAPIEQSVEGTVVVPHARFGGTVVRDLRMVFSRGEITRLSASSGEEVVRAAIADAPALNHFREFALGFNTKLVAPQGHEWLPYYGYGAGVVRLSLGNNIELGGAVRGVGVRWFFFPDATVTVGDTVLVDRGRLIGEQ